MSKTKKRTDYLKNAEQLRAFLDCNRANFDGLWKTNYDPVRLAKKTLLQIQEDKLAVDKDYLDGVDHYTDPFLLMRLGEDYFGDGAVDCDITVRWKTKFKHLTLEQLINTPLTKIFNLRSNDKQWYKKATELHLQKLQSQEKHRAENTFTKKNKKVVSIISKHKLNV